VFGARGLEKVSLRGLDHVISITAHDGLIYWRTFYVGFKRSDGRVPRVMLQPMGPNFDLVLRRTQFASADLEKESLRQPKELKPSKTKNVSQDIFGETMGRVHMERQDFTKLQLRKMKGMRKRKAGDMEAEGGEGGGGGGEEGGDDSDVEAAAEAVMRARAGRGGANKRARKE
jgi:ribosome production factor 2